MKQKQEQLISPSSSRIKKYYEDSIYPGTGLAISDPQQEVGFILLFTSGTSGSGQKVVVTKSEPASSLSSEDIIEVHERTGLTWSQLADVFGVSRRSVHNWAKGDNISAANLEQLGCVLEIAKIMDAREPALNRYLLSAHRFDGKSILDLLKEKKFEQALAKTRELIQGIGRRQVKRPQPLSEAERKARAGLSPAELLSASEEPNPQTGKLKKALPLRKPKKEK